MEGLSPYYILLLAILYFNHCISLQLTIEIDYKSTVGYLNYECGGTHDVMQDGNGILVPNNTIKFPPCRNISDAGYRSRQFYYRDTIYNNASIQLIFVNDFDWENTIINSGIRFGDLRYYCGFEIIVKDQPNAIISIDGTNSNGYRLIDYYGYEYGDPICDANYPTYIKLRNLNFINWKRTIVTRFTPLETTFQAPIVYIDFTSITTSFTNILMVSNPYLSTSLFNITFNNCNFSNIYANSLTTLLYSVSPMTINNCIFKNVNLNFPLVVSENGGCNISDVYFQNVTLTNNAPIISSHNYQTNLNNIIIDGCTISPFWTFTFTNKYQSSNNKINNIHFKNNQFLTSLLISSYSKYNSLFNLALEIEKSSNIIIKVDFTNITFYSNINLSNKDFLFTYSIDQIKFSNINVPNIFSTSISSNNLTIYIDNTTKFNSDYFIKGSNNIINFDKKKSDFNDQYLNYIENNQLCLNCSFYYFHQIITNSSSDGFLNIDNENGHNGIFNKILLAPIIIISIIIIISLISGVIFRKKIKTYFKKKKSQNNNNENDIGGAVVDDIGIPMSITNVSNLENTASSE
ncbi:hypothetical protein ACTA71_006932 [Dictyostelium dimigraforme]